MVKKIQSRALKTRRSILDALEDLLVSKEFEDISIADLAKHAKVAVGSVYSHFKDKDALLPALLERQNERNRKRLDEFIAKGTIEGVKILSGETNLKDEIRRSIDSAYRQITETRGIRRALLTYRRRNPDAQSSPADNQYEQVLKALAVQFSQYSDEIVHSDILKATKFVNYFLNIIFLEQAVFLTSPFPKNFRPDDEALKDIYTEILYKYLTEETTN